MENTLNERLNKTVKLLINEMKLQSTKISELEKKLELSDKRTKKLEKALDDEKDQIDKRFDNVIERFDDCNDTIVDHIDSIVILESKSSELTSQIGDLNNAIKKVDAEIKEIENKKQSEVPKEYCENEVKECKFNKFGYCFKGEEKCEFYHSSNTCKMYLESGLCNRIGCRERHPRPCYYYQQGYCKRREDCKYLHLKNTTVNTCKNCEAESCQIYFCEFCLNSYCCHCTVKEAHSENVYDYEDVGCKNIHIEAGSRL